MHQGINTVADKVDFVEHGMPIIQSRNMTNGILDLADVKFVNIETYNKYAVKYKPLVGNVLMANIGTIGKTLVINEDVDFLIAWNVFLMSLSLDKIHPTYL